MRKISHEEYHSAKTNEEMVEKWTDIRDAINAEGISMAPGFDVIASRVGDHMGGCIVVHMANAARDFCQERIDIFQRDFNAIVGNDDESNQETVER